MSTAQLRRSIKKKIDSLPPQTLQTAAHFISFLAEMPDDRFDGFLASRSPIEQRIKQAQKEFAVGKGTPLHKLRRKY